MMLTREQFHQLIGQVRANGSCPDDPLLAVYDALCEQVDGLTAKYQVLVSWHDKQIGTPCEQIRHQQEVESLREQVARVEQERDRYDHALHSLTVGGSEFAHDADACVGYVFDQRHRQHEIILKFKRERDAFKQQLAAQAARMAELEQELTDIKRRIQ